MPASDEDIARIVISGVDTFANTFAQRYRGKSGQKNLLKKTYNPFIRALGEDILIYSALMRSLDSSMGNLLQNIAQAIARKSYDVSTRVEGYVPVSAERRIASLMASYVDKSRKPKASDIDDLLPPLDPTEATIFQKREADYHLVSLTDPTQHYLLELKIGGDLDNKKSRSEKQALLEQYAILKYSVQPETQIHLYFATAYNKDGEDIGDWRAGSVGWFFAQEEIMVAGDFWNFICDREDGHQKVLQAYLTAAPHLRETLQEIVSSARSINPKAATLL